MTRLLRFLLVVVPLCLGLCLGIQRAAQAAPCTACALPDGTYTAVPPPGWNGRTQLRLLLFLHGWMMEGADIARDRGIRDAAARLGFLLVAPDGVLRSWSHHGAPAQLRDDLSFLHHVVADVEARWPIDRGAVIAAGFSQGGSMVWDLACYAPDGFTAFLPFSGGFWEPMPRACPGGPVVLRHVHGRDDPVVPLGGRALFGPFAQADIIRGFAVWAATDRCVAPVQLARRGDLSCQNWVGCAAGRLQLCLRPGGHWLRGQDVEDGLRWALAGNP